MREHPDEVRGRRVLDFATGSGLVAIAAARAGAAQVIAADIDPFAEAAVAMNARANGVRVAFVRARPARRAAARRSRSCSRPTPGTRARSPSASCPWLRAAAARGIRVLVGDPGRRYLPDPATAGLVELARYDVHTTTVLEDRALVEARVFALGAAPPR